MKRRFLSIRYNAILHLATMFLAIIIIVFFAMRIFAFRGAEKLDKDQAILQVQRIIDGIIFTTEHMKLTASDWSQWDETFEYVEGTNPTYIEENLYLEAFESIDIDAVMIYNLSNVLIHHVLFDFDAETLSLIPSSMLENIETLDLPSMTDIDTQVSGVMSYQDQLYIVVTSPITRSDYSNDTNGTLIFVKRVDEDLIHSLENIVNLPFQIIPNDTLNSEHLIEITQIGDLMKIQRLILDLNDHHDLMIEMTIPMENSVIIRQAITNVTWIVSLILLVFLFILIVMLDKQLFQRIQMMMMDIQQIEAKNDIHLRLKLDQRQDEITFIAQEINQMLDQLDSSYQEINALAYSDHLTGIHNRISFYRLIEEKMSSNPTPYAILFLDLDGFKTINDTYGHETGDFVLIEIAKRIRDIIGTNGFISRAGGDEFLIYHPSNQRKELARLCQKIIDTLASEIEINHIHVNITTSIGIATYPESGKTLQSLIKQSDLAMYQAKTLGKNQFQFDDQQ